MTDIAHKPVTVNSEEFVSQTGTKEIQSADMNIIPPVKEEGRDHCDLESKIEIEEDMIFKTESADLSELVQGGFC